VSRSYWFPVLVSTATSPRLPLAVGVYAFAIWCSVGETLEDYVWDAGAISVVEGDYLRTGKLPPKTLGDFLVAHTWTVKSNHTDYTRPPRDMSIERPFPAIVDIRDKEPAAPHASLRFHGLSKPRNLK
jgi:hypothetical protein